MYKELNAELRTISVEIEDYRKENPRGEQLDAQMVDIIRMMNRMSWVARREGLLCLEEECLKPGGHWPCFDLWKKLVLLVVDGTDPEFVKEFAISRYYAMNIHDYDALAVMIYIEFARNIQNGVNPRVIEELMLALVPECIEKEYREMAKYEKNEDWYKRLVHEDDGLNH